MAPTCETCGKSDSASAAAAAIHQSYCDVPPFHGMFDCDDDDGEDLMYQVGSNISRYPTNTNTNTTARNIIPEASETFLRVMQQLDSAKDDLDPETIPTSNSSKNKNSSNGCTKPKELKSAASALCEKSREQRSVKVVKKSASFSSHHSSLSSSSSSSSSSSKAAFCAQTGDRSSNTDAASRRMSMPCTRREKHVQWADQVGAGAQLVSVRLIRPRVEAKEDDKAASSSSPARSILRRLGVTKNDKPVSEERSLFRRLGVGRR